MNLVLSVVVIAGLLVSGWPRPTTLLGSVAPDSPASRAGLLAGDRIVSIDGEEVWRWQDLTQAVRESKGREMVFGVDRDGDTLELRIKPDPIGGVAGYRVGVEQQRLFTMSSKCQG